MSFGVFIINANSLVLNNEYVKVFSYGNEFFNDLRKTLKTANNFIMIFSYIFADDNIGNEILKHGILLFHRPK